MKPTLAAIAVFLLSSLCVACGGSGSGGDGTAEVPPLELVSPTEDVTVARGEKVLFEAVMSEPDRYTSVEFYYDEDAEWDNGNEHAAAFALPAASFTAEWDTVAVNPGEYRIAVVVYQEGVRSIGYADFTVTVVVAVLWYSPLAHSRLSVIVHCPCSSKDRDTVGLLPV